MFVKIFINVQSVVQARGQKFAMGGLIWGSGDVAPSRRRPMGVWGRNPQLPEASGGLGAKPLAAGGWGSGGKASSRWRHGGPGAKPPALKNFAFFAKIA